VHGFCISFSDGFLFLLLYRGIRILFVAGYLEGVGKAWAGISAAFRILGTTSVLLLFAKIL
jgi:hypothetical protein